MAHNLLLFHIRLKDSSHEELYGPAQILGADYDQAFRHAEHLYGDDLVSIELIDPNTNKPYSDTPALD